MADICVIKEHKCEDYRTKKIEKIERVAGYVINFVSIILSFGLYDTNAEHTFLRVWFYLAILLGIALIFVDLHNKIDKTLIRGIRCISAVAILGCYFVSVFFRITDNKVIITGEEYSIEDSFESGNHLSADSIADIDEVEESRESELLDDVNIVGSAGGSDGFVTMSQGGSYYRIMTSYGFGVTIDNNSQRSVEIEVKDVVNLELLGYIPYEQLDIGSMTCVGGDFLLTPTVF